MQAQDSPSLPDTHKPVANPGRTGTRRTVTAQEWPDSLSLTAGPGGADRAFVELEQVSAQPGSDSLAVTPVGLAPIVKADPWDDDAEETRTFNLSPTRAVWLSALCPGLGQLYNRRYWKLPIVIGGFLGLGYATSWNNSMLRDYSRAYFDLMDNDPATHSYMDFFPSTTQESDLNRTWLENVLKSRKDFYRRNRDLCIISMVAVYLLAMVDAYVDASLSHFDISPTLSMDMAPAIIPDTRSHPGLGMCWALHF